MNGMASSDGNANDGTAAAPVVLVVEDEAMIRMLLADAFEYAGFAVVEANSADAAIEAFADQRDIAVVVTDVRMPGSMDGLGLAAWIGDHQPAVPVIVCSGMQSQSDLLSSYPAIVHVVSKPYMPSDVADLVATLVAGRGKD